MSFYSNFQEDESLGRTIVETGGEVAFGMLVGAGVGAACVFTVGIGCGAAAAGGVGLVVWKGDDAGELVGDIGDTAADVARRAWSLF